MRDRNGFLILIVVNVIVYFLGTFLAVRSGIDIYTMLGAQSYFVLHEHEYYRIITYAFAHGDLMHLI